jgi:hypothetical protein
MVGLGALAFFMFLMFVMARNEDMANRPSLVDEGLQSPDQVLRDAAPASVPPNSAEFPAKPVKPAPLNEH